MRKTGTMALMGMMMALALGGISAAQDGGPPRTPEVKPAPPATPDMSKGRMPKGMSEVDMKTMMACRGMHEDAMRRDKTCMDMMKAHPDMMKPK